MNKRNLVKPVSKKARAHYLDFCYQLFLEGYQMPTDIEVELMQAEYIPDTHKYKAKPVDPVGDELKRGKRGYVRPQLLFKNEAEQQSDEEVSIIDASAGDEQSELAQLILQDKYISKALWEEAIVKSGKLKYTKTVETVQWKIPKEELFNHTKEFYHWISSINKGFQYKIDYWRYNLYLQQASDWLSDKTNINDFENYDDRVHYVNNEQQRCRENSLYFLNKYFLYKDSAQPTGFARYIAYDAQQVAAFLIDSGYNLMFGKARQILFTTTMFGIALKRTMLHKSYFSKIITADTKKAEGTFEEKVKAPYYGMTYYIRPPKPFPDTKTSIGFFKDKSKQEGAGSLLTIENPTITAINSGTPDAVYIDEIGLIDIVTEMINEGLPAMMRPNPTTGKQEQRGQMIAWGSSDMLNNPMFESVFRAALNNWDAHNFSYGLIPVFFNAYARPFMDEKLYEIERNRYYSITGIKQEESRIQFHSSYPVTIDDMFLRNSQTLIPIKEISGAMKRINDASIDFQCQYGWFEPILDMSKPMLNDKSGDVGYKIVGSTFVPAEDPSDQRVSAMIFRHPEKGWQYRYYKGTDPIANSSGHSRFSSSIWDNLTETVSACVNFRVTEHRYCFLQSLLLGLYYDVQINELVESNAGQNYIDYCDAKGFIGNFVPNMALPRLLQTPSGNVIGINKRGNTARWILNELIKMLDLHINNIWIYEFFVQLKTFVRKETTTNLDNFKVDDAKINFDDLIDAITYAYICGQTFQHISPKDTSNTSIKRKVMRYAYDDNYNMVLEEKLI